ncbi:hypothetical protein [Nocardioides sp. Kera G14]|nr:hypothetical protein [Nocardioides sp. Kera G14]UDY24897.1 hypothetical protein LH076_06280 [Nocardioides sp. Kera G14]
MSLFSVIASLVVAAGVVVLILLFERKRARQIQHDLREPDEGRTRRPPRH